MRRIGNWLGLAIVAATGACYLPDQGLNGPGTMPSDVPQQQREMSGPPGGGMDPGYQAASTGYRNDYAQPQPDVSYGDPGAGYADPGAQPGQAPAQDPAMTGPVTDPEIDSTLDGYGSWTEDDDYGRVWRPDPTIVGADFTPYETGGAWVDTDYGWGFNCDYDWGWLPFHYGRWGMFDGAWGWQPGYEWGASWVDWRNGGGYVGWRPQGPIVRDHRGQHTGPEFHDHRTTSRDSQWRFASQADFTRPNIRAHELKNPAEGLRVTAPVARLPIRSNVPPVRAASLMHGRAATSPQLRGTGRPIGTQPGVRSTPTWQGNRSPQWHQPDPARQPTWRPQGAIAQPTQAWRQPTQTYRPPAQTYRPPAQTYYRPPAQTYRPPAQTYRPPAQTYYRPPAQTYHPTYSAPSQATYSAPSHSSGGGGGGHSFGGGGGGGGHSFGGGGGHSGGGGGHHR